MLNRYSRFDNIWSNLTMIGYLVESNADTGMRNCWINGVHHQGITTLRITFKEHLPTLWFKPIERRFRAEQKTLSNRSKDAFELNKRRFQADRRKIFKQIKGRFSSRSKDDFQADQGRFQADHRRLQADQRRLQADKKDNYKQMSKPRRAETEVICNQEL